MQQYLIVGRTIGVVGGVWFFYELLMSIQRAGRFLWYSPFFNFLSLGGGFLLVLLLMLPWKWVSRSRLWRFVFSLFVLVAVLYLVELIPAMRYGGAPYMIMAFAFLVVQGFCFWMLRRESQSQSKT